MPPRKRTSSVLNGKPDGERDALPKEAIRVTDPDDALAEAEVAEAEAAEAEAAAAAARARARAIRLRREAAVASKSAASETIEAEPAATEVDEPATEAAPEA